MKFKMNDREWIIKEVSQEELQKENGNNEEGEYYGTTFMNTQEIWLWKDISREQKRKTLIHELTHCYMYCYISFNDIKFEIDDFCDISANSHNVIHKIVEDYFSLESKGEQ